MFKNLIHKFILIIGIAISNTAMAQTVLCSGALGDPIKKIDFGRGTPQHGSPIPETSFNFQPTGTPEDGWYTIAKSTAGMHVGSWHQIGNHTPNDPNGYMMIVNANYNPSIFYEATIKDLCANTTYEFAAWVINLMINSGNKPNLTFTISTVDGRPLAEPYNTGNIPEGSANNWIHPGFLFTTPAGVSEVVISIRNNGPGGGGNDIAIDDITFSPCGPVIIPSIDEVMTSNKSICVGQSRDFILSVEPLNVYTNPQYLWQEMNADEEWQDLQQETSIKFTKEFRNAQVGSYKYRLLVAENGNINSINCRVTSPTFEFYVSPLPDPQVANPSITVCVGEPIHLSVSNFSKYEWTGPLGFSSSVRSPIIDNATLDMTGTYHVTVTNDAGCVASTQIEVTVVPRPVAVIDPVPIICKGESITLYASGGLTYRWEPSSTLSGIDSANPVVNPTETTVYTVYVSNDYCETPQQIEVVVREELIAMAGSDFSILKGNSIRLDGSATGDDIGQIFWTPADHLDDPTILNPIYSPPKNGTYTYTLNIISEFGCTSSTDQVSIKVYEKIIVPNSFSPNGDGINDTWNIIGIDTYSHPTVKVMNRYGQQMFEGKGDKTSWDGKWRNEDVPVGVYYYIVNLEPGVKPLSGSLMVIR